MQVVSLAQVNEVWWIVTFEENEQGWNFKQFKPAKANRLKSEARAKQSAQSKGLPFMNIDFSKEQMDRVVSFVQAARNRKQQRQSEKEDRRQLRQQSQEATPQPRAIGNSRKREGIHHTLEFSDVHVKLPSAQSFPQPLLEEVQYVQQQLTEIQGQRDELEREVNRLNKKNGDLKKQVAQLQEEVSCLRAQLKKK